MDNGGDILQLCRLCLVKDDVNIPIFDGQGDIRQIFLKISSCLPVKVSREDQLPKKICDGCSYKLDMLYEFWNTTANAEKQLLSWLGEAGMNSKMNDDTISAVAQQIKPVETFVKQETIDPSDIHTEENDDDKTYMFQQKYSVEEAGPSATTTATANEEEPPPKRARRTAAVKAQIAMDPESDYDDDSGEPITKVEDESEESEGEDQEPAFVDVPSTSADDQPGPSGVGKDGVEAPSTGEKTEEEEIIITFVDEEGHTQEGDFNIEYVKLEDLNYVTYVDDKNILIENNSNIMLNPLKQNNNNYNKGKTVKEELSQLDELLMTYEEEIESQKIEQEPIRSKKLNKPVKSKKAINNPGSHYALCAICGKLVKARSINKHLSNHGSYKCDQCSSSFKTSEELEKHKEVHLDNEYPCEICILSFKTATEIALHNYIHSNVYLCPKCPFKTKSKSSICGHIKRHEGQYKYRCNICGKGFIGKALLQTHEEIHLDIKRYNCEFCSKKFSVKRYLDVHRQLNHKKELYGVEELFQCDVCGRQFTFEKSLRRHQSVIHQIGEDRTVECKICNKVIANNYNLKLHMRIHTGEKNYCCDLCGKAFSAYKYWKKHKLTHEKRKISNEDEEIEYVELDVNDIKVESPIIMEIIE